MLQKGKVEKKNRIFKAGLMQQNVSLQLNREIVNNLERNVKFVLLKSRIFFLLLKLFLFINVCIVKKFQKDT